MPKKKGGKKGAKIVDGVATSEMTREQLIGHVRRIQMELDREREERNFFMLEREKLFALWNITMEELRTQKVKTQLATEQMTEHDVDKQLDVLKHKQKLRYLLTEQSQRVDESRLDGLKKLRKAQEDMLAIQSSLKESVDQKSKELRQAQIALQDVCREMKLEAQKSMSKVKNEERIGLARVERDFSRLAIEKETKDALAYENESEILHNKHRGYIEEMEAMHATEMAKIKQYFHSITTNNVATIIALQSEIGDMKTSQTNIIDELKKSTKDMHDLEMTIKAEREERKKNAAKDYKVAGKFHQEMKELKKLQATKDKYTRSMEVTNECLLHKVKSMEHEGDVLKRTLVKSILEMQQDAAKKQMLLELKLRAASRQQQAQRQPLVMLPDSTESGEKGTE